MFSQSRYISYLLSVSCLLSPPGFCYRHWSTGRVLKASERNVPDIEIHRVQCCMQKVIRWGISEGLRFFLEPLSLSQLLTYIKHCIAALPIDIALHSLRSWSTLLPLYGLPSLPHPHCLQWLPDLEKTSDEIGWINMDQLYVFFSYIFDVWRSLLGSLAWNPRSKHLHPSKRRNSDRNSRFFSWKTFGKLDTLQLRVLTPNSRHTRIDWMTCKT